MTEVIAKSQDGTETVSLDLKDPRIELSFELQNNSKLSERSSPHSLNFKLPRTKKNNKFFNHYHEVNIANGSWSAYSETTVEVYDEGIVIMIGVLQLNTVNTDQYNVNILGTTADLFQAIRGKSFADLFNSIGVDLDHALTSNNVIDSWNVNNDITNGSVGNGTVIYPLIDTGWLYENGFVFLNADFNIPILVRTLKPSIRVKYLFSEIFKFAGYTPAYCAELTSDRFEDLYMFLATEQKVVAARALYGAKIGLTSNTTIAASTTNLVSILPTNEVAPFFDPDNLFSAGVFTAPFDGVFQFSVQMVLSTAATTPYYFTFAVSSSTQAFSNQVLVPASANAGYVYTANFQLTCTATQQVTFEAGAECGSDVIINTGVSGNNTFVSVPLYDTENPTGAVVDMLSNMPDMTLDEWLKGIIDKYNIILDYDIFNPTVIKVETALEYFAGGAEKNWTKKLDLSSERVIEPTTSLQKKRMVFSDAEGKDYKNEWWQRNWGWVKGRYIYENTNDFAVDEEEIGDVFVPLRTDTIRINNQTEDTVIPNVLVSRQWVNAENGVKQITNKPILAFYHRLKDIGNGHTWNVDGTSISQYPYFSVYSDSPVDEDTVSLNWGYDYPDDDTHPFVNGVPFFFMFRKYWASYIQNIYDDEARLMRCSAYLTPQDVQDLRFSDKIWLQDSYWRVLGVTNYVVSGNQPCKLNLLKVLDKGDWDCDLIPDTYNTDGTVDFVSAVDGTAQIASQACCERFGYKYDPIARVCFYKAVSPSIGGNPSVPSIDSSFTLDGGPTDTPSPIENSSTKSYAASDFTANQVQFAMQGLTTGNKAQSLNIINGGQEITITPNTVYTVDLDVIVVQTGGSAGTTGDVDALKMTGTVKTWRGTSAAVGNFTTLSHHSDHNNSHGVSWSVSGGSNRATILELQVTGQANHILRWYVHVNLTEMNLVNLI